MWLWHRPAALAPIRPGQEPGPRPCWECVDHGPECSVGELRTPGEDRVGMQALGFVTAIFVGGGGAFFFFFFFAFWGGRGSMLRRL